MHVIATAGHVDHGKSTLVRALTGMEPDRWAEERRRGMTIDLGFAWTALPTGSTVAFVDVPGHERFVPNMLAGVGPVPAVMFVVAADEGWMPQSREHLEALHALDVRHGLLVVTRSDLMDPELAREEALVHLTGSSLDKVGSVCVSGVTGAGLDELRAALGSLVAELPAPDVEADVRLWVDRAFTIRGVGTVVTGTLAAGTIQVGDELALAVGQRRVSVRGLQSLGTPVQSAPAVARVAVNLRGLPREAVRRGDALLTPETWLPTSTIDVRLYPVARHGDISGQTGPSAPRYVSMSGWSATELPEHVVLHVGAAAVAARVRPLGGDTARLGLAQPLPLRIGDRALVRDPGARRIPAGVTVLDVRPPVLRRRGAAAARAAVLSMVDSVADGVAELRRRGFVRRDELRAMGAPVPAEAAQVGGWLADPSLLAQRADLLAAAVAEHAAANPLEPGMPLEAARRLTGMPDARLVELLLGSQLALAQGRVHLRGPAAGIPDAVRTAIAAIRAELAQQPFAAPEAHRLAELGLGTKQLAAAVRAGELLKIADGIYLGPGADDDAIERLGGLSTPFTLSQARQALGTTRRVAVPLMEHLARRGITRRLPDGSHELL
ncbi:MAG TPA: selenocysteine-specific translation elongation factor [Pseudonocardiaceae bacterium]|nr:selenocysteine-specific translation elongation factor [Pseudonocardiaceae bacterium]